MDSDTITALSTLAVAFAGLVAALSAALARRAKAKCRDRSERVTELRQALAMAPVVAGLLKPRRDKRVPVELEVLRDALLETGARFVCGAVDSRSRYLWVLGYRSVLGHEDVEGCAWTDPRFVDAADLENSITVSGKSIRSQNRGESIRMKTAAGAVLDGRVWSAPLRTIGPELTARFFVVVFDSAEGS